MYASYYGHHEVVRTLLQGGADVNVKSKVRNQMMMMMIIIVLHDGDDDDVDDDSFY